MKKIYTQVFAFIVLALPICTVAQVSTPFNIGLATHFVGWNAAQNFPLQIRHNGAFPINFLTTNQFRMKINPNISYQVNLLGSQPKNGFTLIGPNTPNGSGTGNLYDNTWGAFSLLHLNGDGQFVEEWGFRNWMRTGITFTGNRDLAYMGLRKLSTNEQEEDMTETTIAWTDNNGQIEGKIDNQQIVILTKYVRKSS